MSIFDEDLFVKGLEKRKATLGASYVESNLEAADDFTRPFQEAMTAWCWGCLLYTSPSPRDLSTSRMPSSA